MTNFLEYNQAVVWGDMDAFGHVNNVHYLRYFETARVFYFGKLNAMEIGTVKPILASISCQYKRPVVYPDTLTMRIGVKNLGNSSITMECEMISQKTGELAAAAECVIVMFDFENNRPTRVPDVLRQAVERVGNSQSEA